MIGQVIKHYRIDALIGEGGMGSVYRGTDLNLQRPVAIKILHPQLMRDPGLRERFLSEARIQGRLSHAGIVSVFDFDLESGMIVMEMVNGIGLDRIIENGGPLPPAACLEIMRQLLQALGYAHNYRDDLIGNGIVHRDIKPSNVLIEQRQDKLVAKLADFGIAKIAGDIKSKTAAGAKMGTIHYMSPEQIKSARDAGTQSDIYSLGVTLFEMLSGRVPFDEMSEYDLMMKIIEAPLPSVRQLAPGTPPAVEAVIARATAKNAADRYPTCADFERDLVAALGGAGGQVSIPLAPGPAYAPQPAPHAGWSQPTPPPAGWQTPAPPTGWPQQAAPYHPPAPTAGGGSGGGKVFALAGGGVALLAIVGFVLFKFVLNPAPPSFSLNPGSIALTGTSGEMVSAASLSVVNTGKAPITPAVREDLAWLDVTGSLGTLAPGQSGSINLAPSCASVNSAAGGSLQGVITIAMPGSPTMQQVPVSVTCQARQQAQVPVVPVSAGSALCDEAGIRALNAQFAQTQNNMDLNAHMALFSEWIVFYNQTKSRAELGGTFSKVFYGCRSMEMIISNEQISTNGYSGSATIDKYVRYLKGGGKDMCFLTRAIHKYQVENGRCVVSGIDEVRGGLRWRIKHNEVSPSNYNFVPGDCSNVSPSNHP